MCTSGLKSCVMFGVNDCPQFIESVCSTFLFDLFAHVLDTQFLHLCSVHLVLLLTEKLFFDLRRYFLIRNCSGLVLFRHLNQMISKLRLPRPDDLADFCIECGLFKLGYHLTSAKGT